VNLQPAGKIGVDIVEEVQKFPMPVPSVTTADGDSAGHIQGREQRRNSMPFIIM
jgi:hypothetical protein